MALCASSDELGGDDESAEGVAGSSKRQLYASDAGVGSKARVAGHDGKVLMEAERSFVD